MWLNIKAKFSLEDYGGKMNYKKSNVVESSKSFILQTAANLYCDDSSHSSESL